MLTPDARLARIAERQYGVFTFDQALACEFSPKTIAYRLASGRWHRLHRGVYVLVGTPRSFEQQSRAAVFAGGPTALASHRTAGELFQLEGIVRQGIEIIVGVERRARVRGVVVHQSRTLTRRDRATILAIPVTTPVRTLIDLAAVVEEDLLEDALHDAVRRQLVRLDSLGRRLERMQRRGSMGTGVLLALVRDTVAKGVPGSGRENRLRRALVKAGLDEPVRQHKIHDRDGNFVARVDLAYPQDRIYIEYDGGRHADPRRWQEDLARQNRLSELGWLPLRFTKAELRQPAATLASKVVNAKRSSVDAKSR